MKFTFWPITALLFAFSLCSCIPQTNTDSVVTSTDGFASLCEQQSSSTCISYSSPSLCARDHGTQCITTSVLDPMGAYHVCSSYDLSPTHTTGCGQMGASNVGATPSCSGTSNLVLTNPSSANLGAHFQNDSDFVTVLTYRNLSSGSCSAQVGSVTLSDPGNFDLDETGCLRLLLPNETCNIYVKSLHSNLGAHSATLTFSYTVLNPTTLQTLFTPLNSTVVSDTVQVLNSASSPISSLNWPIQSSLIPFSSCSTLLNYGLSYQGFYLSSPIGIEIYGDVTLPAGAPSGLRFAGIRTGTGFNYSTDFIHPTLLSPYAFAGYQQLYFQNASGNTSYLTGTGMIYYRPSGAGSGTPYRVKSIPLSSYCY